ncbi:MAG TPA: hypothetical protein VK171_05825 [Fimbriimonas sp.]|nr:hypothetical protein [Fimbriimonas sp.]
MRKLSLALTSIVLLANCQYGFANNAAPSLSKAKQYVTRAESAMNKATSILDKSEQDSALQSAQNQLDQAEGHLGKAKTELDEVPDSESGKAEVKKLLDDANAAFDALKERINKARGNISKQDETNAQGAANDATTVEALSDTVAKMAVHARSITPNMEIMSLWPQVKKDTEAMLAKYGETKGSRGANREFVFKVGDLKSEYNKFQADIKGPFTKRMGNTILASIGHIQGYIKNAQQTSNFSYFIELIPRAERQLRDCMDTYVMLGTGHADFSQDILDQAEAQFVATKEAAKKLEQEIIATNVVPKEGYTGGDLGSLKATLTARFQEANPKAKILKVIIQDPNWTRTIAWKWDDRLFWYKEDSSILACSVIIAGDDPKQAYIFGTPFVRDHLQGGATKVVVPKNVKKPSPNFILLASKVK